MEQKPKHLSSFQIASTYIGVIIGAGFASGQEVIQYFAFFGPFSVAALFLATLFIVFFGWWPLWF